MATDEEVEEQRQRVHELRARVEEAKTSGGETQRQLENEITLVQLGSEEATLQAELDALNHQNATMSSQATPLASALDQMTEAVARQKAGKAAINESNKASAPAAPAVKVADDKKNVEG